MGNGNFLLTERKPGIVLIIITQLFTNFHNVCNNRKQMKSSSLNTRVAVSSRILMFLLFSDCENSLLTVPLSDDQLFGSYGKLHHSKRNVNRRVRIHVLSQHTLIASNVPQIKFTGCHCRNFYPFSLVNILNRKTFVFIKIREFHLLELRLYTLFYYFLSKVEITKDLLFGTINHCLF